MFIKRHQSEDGKEYYFPCFTAALSPAWLSTPVEPSALSVTAAVHPSSSFEVCQQLDVSCLEVCQQFRAYELCQPHDKACCQLCLASAQQEAPDDEWEGRMIPSIKRLSTREEELYKSQLAELQAEDR